MKNGKRLVSLILILTILGSFMVPMEAVGLTALKKETSFSSMLQRAEALINYEWVPSERIYTWNDNEYNGKNYFEAGETVKGVPYTLFSWELGFDSLLSLEQYKAKSSVNYSTEKYCNSVSANRIGPAYGNCCATLVSEVFGGSFMNGSNPRYDGVGTVQNSTYSTTYSKVKISAIQPGDALSCTSGAHIVWVGGVTDDTITIYESTPPICRKVVLDKTSNTDSNGYLTYGGNTYNIATKSNEVIRDDLSSVADLSADIPMPIHAYTQANEKTLVYDAVNGNAKTNKIYGTDLCFIDAVFDNGWCHVNFPLDAGGLEHGYVKTDVFFNTENISTDTAKSSVPVYNRSDMSTSIGRVASESQMYFICETENACQVAYSVTSGGYKLGWVSKKDLENASQDSFLNQLCPMKGYPCVEENFEVKKSDYSTRGGEIYTTDFCTINEIYTNGWCKVTFPMDSGGTRTAYTKISNFIKSPSTALTKYTATSYINLYSTASMSTQIYRIYPGDVCYTIGTSGSATQIFMPMSNGGYYVLGWAVLPPAQQSSGYDVPFKCRTISTEKVKCYNDINFTSSPGNIYPTDDCVITAVYSNGKVQVSCPWSDGTTKTVYVNKSVFINSNTTPQNTTAPKYAKTYLRTDMGTNIGWIDAGDKIQIVATSGTKTQIIYPADVGKRCAWVNTTDLAQTYKVTYNANGGTGAPDTQTKNHGENLALSSAKPTRTGHTFVGWAETASATSAAYSAGSIYSNNKNVTLYAVWRKQTYTITYNANLGENAPGVQTQTYGTAVTVTNEKPSKTYTVTFNANGGTVDTQYYSFDCEFTGWNTKADGTGTTIKSSSSYTPNANVTLYAVYSNPTFESYPIPTREGYTFEGWHTAVSGGTKMDATSVVSSNTTLYAQWEKEIYSIIYYDEEAINLPAEQEKTNSIDLTLSNQIPMKAGYVFKGWTLDPETNSVDYLPGAKYTSDQSAVLYAVWEKETVSATVTGISLQSMPTKTVYTVGETFNSSGLSLKVNMSDGTSKTVTSGFTVSSPNMSTAGTKNVTVTYQEKAVSFMITVNPKEAINPNSAKILIENKNAVIGNTVEMAVKLENNPGIASMTLQVSYDSSAMQLISVTDAGKLGTAVHSDNYTSPYSLCWANDTAKENYTDNGTIVTLKFRILDTAAVGNYPISVSYNYENFDIYNVNVEKVKLEPVNGSITVSNVLIGDVNGDGAVNNLDRLVLTRYLANWVDYPESVINMAAADMNNDGAVNNLDRLILTRHLANWTDYDALPYVKK